MVDLKDFGFKDFDSEEKARGKSQLVIDIKDYSGLVLYDSNLLWVNEFKTEQDRLGDVKALIQKFHDNDIYVIARQTVFQDPILAERKPEWAIQSRNGGLWRDHKGLAWVDPTEKAVWRYNLAIAKEAILLGFDEINFDYVRFPSDGNLSLVVYTNGQQDSPCHLAQFQAQASPRFLQYIHPHQPLNNLQGSIPPLSFQEYMPQHHHLNLPL